MRPVSQAALVPIACSIKRVSHSMDDARLKVVRKMYAMRFGEPAPERRSIEQLRGIEGARVKRLYELQARENGITWRRRDFDSSNWSAADVPNRCLSSATSCLYGLAEAAILAAGYAPAIGFLHTGKPQSFVYDIADVYKFETVVPIAFQIAGRAARGKLASDPARSHKISARASGSNLKSAQRDRRRTFSPNFRFLLTVRLPEYDCASVPDHKS